MTNSIYSQEKFNSTTNTRVGVFSSLFAIAAMSATSLGREIPNIPTHRMQPIGYHYGGTNLKVQSFTSTDLFEQGQVTVSNNCRGGYNMNSMTMTSIYKKYRLDIATVEKYTPLFDYDNDPDDEIDYTYNYPQKNVKLLLTSREKYTPLFTYEDDTGEEI